MRVMQHCVPIFTSLLPIAQARSTHMRITQKKKKNMKLDEKCQTHFSYLYLFGVVAATAAVTVIVHVI